MSEIHKIYINFKVRVKFAFSDIGDNMVEKEKPVSVELFLRDKPAKILLGLKTKDASVYATILSKKADCTYSHTIKILNVFRDLGLVKFNKTGRIKKVELTDEGMDLAQKMEATLKKLLALKPETRKTRSKKK